MYLPDGVGHGGGQFQEGEESENDEKGEEGDRQPLKRNSWGQVALAAAEDSAHKMEGVTELVKKNRMERKEHQEKVLDCMLRAEKREEDRAERERRAAKREEERFLEACQIQALKKSQNPPKFPLNTNAQPGPGPIHTLLQLRRHWKRAQQKGGVHVPLVRIHKILHAILVPAKVPDEVKQLALIGHPAVRVPGGDRPEELPDDAVGSHDRLIIKAVETVVPIIDGPLVVVSPGRPANLAGSSVKQGKAG